MSPEQAADSPQTADDVIGARRRARRPLRPALVHRRPRPAQELLDQRRRARGRLRGRDGLRRLLDHRLQPDRGVGHDRDARSVDLLDPALAPRRAADGADVLRHPGPRRRALRGRSRAGSCAGRSKRAEEMGFDAYNVGPELEFFYFRDAKPENGDPRGPRRGRLLRPDDARRRRRRPPRDGARARADGHPRRVHPPRGRPLPARGRHALQGRARDGRRLHDLPDHGQGVRDEARLARDLHAEAAERRERLRDARPPVARHATARTPSTTPTTSTSSRRRRRRSSPASSSTRARSRRCSPSGSTPTSASSRATRPRSTSPGRAATARP